MSDEYDFGNYTLVKATLDDGFTARIGIPKEWDVAEKETMDFITKMLEHLRDVRTASGKYKPQESPDGNQESTPQESS